MVQTLVKRVKNLRGGGNFVRKSKEQSKGGKRVENIMKYYQNGFGYWKRNKEIGKQDMELLLLGS